MFSVPTNKDADKTEAVSHSTYDRSRLTFNLRIFIFYKTIFFRVFHYVFQETLLEIFYFILVINSLTFFWFHQFFSKLKHPSSEQRCLGCRVPYFDLAQRKEWFWVHRYWGVPGTCWACRPSLTRRVCRLTTERHYHQIKQTECVSIHLYQCR